MPRSVQRPLAEFARPALHAWKVALAHPLSGEPLEFTAPVPQDLVELWERVTALAVPGEG